MTEIVISIQPPSNAYRQISGSTTPTPPPLKPTIPERRALPSDLNGPFLPVMEGVTLELPPPKLLAEASYQAQLPRLIYATIYDSPSPQTQPPDRRRVASAARVYARQLNMVAYKRGLLVDCYA